MNKKELHNNEGFMQEKTHYQLRKINISCGICFLKSKGIWLTVTCKNWTG